MVMAKTLNPVAMAPKMMPMMPMVMPTEAVEDVVLRFVSRSLNGVERTLCGVLYFTVTLQDDRELDRVGWHYGIEGVWS